MEFIGQPTGHDPDDTGMPAVVGQDEGRAVAGVDGVQRLLSGGLVDTPLQALAALVQFSQVFGQRAGSALVLGDQQFCGQASLAQPPGGVQAWCEREGDVFTGKSGFVKDPGLLHQLSASDGWPLSQAVQAVVDKDPVFIHQGNDVCNGTDGGQSDRL